MSYIAPFILRSEYACKCCGRIPLEVYGPIVEMPTLYYILFESFRWFREDWGKPVNITSGYRCPKHNLEIGGVEYSLHLFGGALDMQFRDDEETVRAAKAIDDSCSDLRMGVYLHGQRRLHVDVGYLVMPRMEAAWVQGERFGDQYV
jgi:hypothetical protein